MLQEITSEQRRYNLLRKPKSKQKKPLKKRPLAKKSKTGGKGSKTKSQSKRGKVHCKLYKSGQISADR